MNPFDEHRERLRKMAQDLQHALSGVQYHPFPRFFAPEVVHLAVHDAYSAQVHMRCGNNDCTAEFELLSLARPERAACPECNGVFHSPIGWN